MLTLKRRQSGDTRNGTNRVNAYRYPVAPFGNAARHAADAGGRSRDALRDACRSSGGERRRIGDLESPGAQIDPFYLGARRREHGAGVCRHARQRERAHVGLPAADRRGRRRVPPPAAVLRRRRLGPRSVHRPQRGRPLRAAFLGRRRDTAVDPAPDGARRRRAADPGASRARRASPVSIRARSRSDTAASSSARRHTTRAPGSRSSRCRARRRLAGGTVELRLVASDFQESKNIDTVGPSIMPNTRSTRVRVRVVAGNGRRRGSSLPSGACLAKEQELTVAASSTAQVRACASCSTAGQIAVGSPYRTGSGARACRPRRRSSASTRSSPSPAALHRRGVSCGRVSGSEPGRGRHRRLFRHRCGARARAREAGLALRAARAARGSAAGARRGDRRRVRVLRRLRSSRRRATSRHASSSGIRASRCS